MALHSKNFYIMKIEQWKTDVKVGRRCTTKLGFNRSEIVGVCWFTHLQLLQSAGDERLTGCLFPAESEHILHGLLKGLPLSNQVSGLHHDEEQVVHLKANPDICNRYIANK